MKNYSLLTFIMPIVILLFSIIWVGYSIVVKNILSKDIVFSFTALSAAFVMFGLNIAFSLKEEQSQHVVRPHIIITDDNIIDVLSYQITKPNFLVFNNEELSTAINIVKLKESLYTQTPDRELAYKNQLITFLKICTLGQILSSYPDWQEQKQKFKYSESTSFNNTKEGAGNNTYFSIEQLDKLMNIEGFTFNGKIGLINGLTLPPDTQININNDNIIIDNPFLTIKINFEIENGFNKATPTYTNGSMMFYHSGTKSDVINIQSNIVMNVTMKKQRSGSAEKTKYSKWVNEFYQKLHSGFDLLSGS